MKTFTAAACLIMLLFVVPADAGTEVIRSQAVVTSCVAELCHTGVCQDVRVENSGQVSIDNTRNCSAYRATPYGPQGCGYNTMQTPVHRTAGVAAEHDNTCYRCYPVGPVVWVPVQPVQAVPLPPRRVQPPMPPPLRPTHSRVFIERRYGFLGMGGRVLEVHEYGRP